MCKAYPAGIILAVASLLTVTVTSCQEPELQNTTLLLSAYNNNAKCIGHAEGLCGSEEKELMTEIAGTFATEPDCHGLRLRGLTEKERSMPGNQLPLLLAVFYEGTHTQSYWGNGKGEDEGFMFIFNGPRGHFSGKSRTERELVSRVCKAAKGLGAEIDDSVGYSH